MHRFLPKMEDAALRPLSPRPSRTVLSRAFPDITSKEAADALRGISLYADRDKLPGLPDDEFYHADLIGLEVVDTGGTVLGQVSAVLNHGAGDLLEVYGSGLTAPILLPFTKAVVPTVDLAAGRIVVDPPEGSMP